MLTVLPSTKSYRERSGMNDIRNLFCVISAFLFGVFFSITYAFYTLVPASSNPSEQGYEIGSKMQKDRISDSKYLCADLCDKEKRPVDDNYLLTAIFFAMQTITTTGYGSGFDANINTVKWICFWGMFWGASAWALWVSALFNLIQGLFRR